MRLFLAFLVVFFYSLTFAQNKFTVIDLEPKTESTVFPLIRYDSDKNIENKINTFLQVQELENIPNTRKNPFELVINATNSYTNYISYYEWRKLESPENILTLTLNGEATGAYSEMFDTQYNFDTRNGNIISIHDVFSKDGIKSLAKNANSIIEKEISDFISEIKNTKPKSSDHKEMLDEQLMIYEDCIGYVQGQDIFWFDFYFEKNDLVLTRGRCSNHAMRALDDLGSFTVRFPYLKLKSYLSNYGKSLIFNEPKNVFNNNPENKLYKGMIDGKYPVTFLFGNSNGDNSLSLVYWYNKHKKLIHIGGKFVNNHFSLIEDGYHSEELKAWIHKANIEADLKGNRIIGTWEDYKTKKKMRLELEEY